ncbi:OmpA/MotB family protein [Flavivirga eckloniae]|uniref:OmpA-like domain-containing protein n=1 Tax=Flavivirga eckloniae TaxID=1803846 RepID=A0A2K9PT51_9FLAO|nr:OmpA family protein [Flavivirga eckloniae]AUP79988.1 hypothetical protein C1H87_15275 [Flavivirga eckloniae]
MKNTIVISLFFVILLCSCVSKKKYAELESKQRETRDLLNSATVKINTCLEDKSRANTKIQSLEGQVNNLNNTNAALINSVGSLATLSKKESEILEKSLESIKEKDLRIRKMQDALNKKDSVTLALVTSLKGALHNMDDTDIQINVEKGVVFVSISDKLLFKSGSYYVSKKAQEVLGKVAKVVNSKPNLEFMVEGHTDNVPYSNNILLDNWDLSVKRATAVVRLLHKKYQVNPKRMTAAGRSHFFPLTNNNSKENRAKNRRTRIVVLPKLDQFYDMIESNLK